MSTVPSRRNGERRYGSSAPGSVGSLRQGTDAHLQTSSGPSGPISDGTKSAPRTPSIAGAYADWFIERAPDGGVVFATLDFDLNRLRTARGRVQRDRVGRVAARDAVEPILTRLREVAPRLTLLGGLEDHPGWGAARGSSHVHLTAAGLPRDFRWRPLWEKWYAEQGVSRWEMVDVPTGAARYSAKYGAKQEHVPLLVGFEGEWSWL